MFNKIRKLFNQFGQILKRWDEASDYDPVLDLDRRVSEIERKISARNDGE